MAANMAELMSLLRNPNRASSSPTPHPGQGSTSNPAPQVPPTHAPEGDSAPAPPTMHAPVIHPANASLPPPLAPAAIPFPPAAFLALDQAMAPSPPTSILVPTLIYIAPQPMATPTSMAFAPVHTAESFPYQAPHTNTSLPC
ncbi:vegetative cell wall protein gp1-like [Punica granatum]|nr:vegetative cell wall protein gp1-like [Punica granatum]